jgi:cytochrome c-type biogenesis protein CcmF
MNAGLGIALLLLAFATTLYALIASLVGVNKENDALVESARNAAIITFPLLTLDVLLLVGLLVASNFSVEYVWSVTDKAMPFYLKVTALWGGQAGSLLFWTWLMSAFAAGVMVRDWRQERALMPHVNAFLMGTLLFFVVVVAFWENPFARIWVTPDGNVISALFAPSDVLNGISTGWAGLGKRVGGLPGVVIRGTVPLAAPSDSFIRPAGNGQGLNPLLRHPGMIIHPPVLYLGFVGFVVPYAFGMAALVRGETGPAWLHATRRWTLIAWLFLSLGLILGGWWAYDVLGWGGYWGWDPVENAALMPWLSGTAFLHSVMIQERRGMLRRWNMLLITLTYLQVVLGTFATRSGFVASVHSFARSAIGPLFFLFLVGALIVSVRLLIRRWDEIASDNQIEHVFSRETVFLVNNLLFLSINLAVAVGTYWPVLTELLAEVRFLGVERSALGAEYYVRTTGPMFLALVLLMGICPLVAWSRGSLRRSGRAMLWPLVVALAVGGLMIGFREALGFGGGVILTFALVVFTALVTVLEYRRGAVARVRAHGEGYPRALVTLFGRNRRRYGGYLIHLGVLIMAVGIVASNAFQLETQQAVAAGQTITLGDYVLEYETLEFFRARDGREVVRAQTVVYKNGRRVARLAPRIDIYLSGQPMSVPAKHTSLLGDDFYVRLITWEEIGLSGVTFRVYYNPLVNWIWGGGLVFVAGMLIAAWPDPREQRRALTAGTRRSAPLPVGGK